MTELSAAYLLILDSFFGHIMCLLVHQLLDGYRSHPPLPANDEYGEDYNEQTSVLGRPATASARVAPKALRIGSPTEQGSSRSIAEPKRRRDKQVVYSSESEQTVSDDDGMTLAERLHRQDRIEAEKRMEEAKASAAAMKARSALSSSQGPTQAPPPLFGSPPRRLRTAAARNSSPLPATTDPQPAPDSSAPEAAKRKASQADVGSQEQPSKKLRPVATMKKATRYASHFVNFVFLSSWIRPANSLALAASLQITRQCWRNFLRQLARTALPQTPVEALRRRLQPPSPAWPAPNQSSYLSQK